MAIITDYILDQAKAAIVAIVSRKEPGTAFVFDPHAFEGDSIQGGDVMRHFFLELSGPTLEENTGIFNEQRLARELGVSVVYEIPQGDPDLGNRLRAADQDDIIWALMRRDPGILGEADDGQLEFVDVGGQSVSLAGQQHRTAVVMHMEFPVRYTVRRS